MDYDHQHNDSAKITVPSFVVVVRCFFVLFLFCLCANRRIFCIDFVIVSVGQDEI